MTGPCAIRFPARLTREPLVDWDHRPLSWWAELLGAAAVPLLFLVMYAVFEWYLPRFDR